MTQELVKELFIYDDNIGRLIRKSNNEIAGYVWKDPKRSNHFYRSIKINYKEYKEHRLIWLYHYGSMPIDQIDHIDGNSINNKIDNLREVTNIINSKNRCIQSNNTVGYHGITMHKGRYRVRININGIRKSCGVYNTFEEAYKIRKELEKQYNYHINHGRKATINE